MYRKIHVNLKVRRWFRTGHAFDCSVTTYVPSLLGNYLVGDKIGAFQRVTKDRLELVKCYTGAVGIAGTHARTYYVEVTNADVSTIILFQINS